DGRTAASGPQGGAGGTGRGGRPGAPGPSGPGGVTGATGPSGPQGATGETRPSGPSGPSGPQGATGATGPSGPAGPEGINWQNDLARTPAEKGKREDAGHYTDGSSNISVTAAGCPNSSPPAANPNRNLLAEAADTGATAPSG